MHELNGGFMLDDKSTLDDRIVLIQNEDVNGEERNNLIKEYIPFILNRVRRSGFMDATRDDEEFSIGLMVFNDCVDKFQKGEAKFLTFTGKMIRFKMLEHIKYLQTHNTWFQFNERLLDKTFYDMSSDYWFQETRQDALQSSLKSELKRFRRELNRRSITFKKLKEKMPTHRDSVEIVYEIANEINENRELTEKVLKRNILTYEDAIEVTTLQYSRAAHYLRRIPIVAILILLNGDYKAIRSILDLK